MTKPRKAAVPSSMAPNERIRARNSCSSLTPFLLPNAYQATFTVDFTKRTKNPPPMM